MNKTVQCERSTALQSLIGAAKSKLQLPCGLWLAVAITSHSSHIGTFRYQRTYENLRKSFGHLTLFVIDAFCTHHFHLRIGLGNTILLDLVRSG